MARLGSLNKNSIVYTENDLSPATSESNGLMSSTDKSKLDGVESGAQLNKIESIKINNSEVAPDQNKVVNISVPTQASQVGALPASTKYGSSIDLSIDPLTYVITIQLKDQDGNNLGNSKVVDLPLETMVVGAEYLINTREIQLSLQNGTTVKFSVSDLVSGLQPTINDLDSIRSGAAAGATAVQPGSLKLVATSGSYNDLTDKPSIPSTPADIGAQTVIDSNHKLIADLIDDSNSNKKFVSSNEKSTWNGKQDAITSTNKLSKDLISGLGTLANKSSVSQSDLDSNLTNQFNDIHAKNEALSSLVNEFGITSFTNPDELNIETLAKIVKGLCLALTTQASN